jgi:hypothetical protein
MKMRVGTISLICLALSAPAFAGIVIYTDGPTNGASNAFFIDGPGAGPWTQTISDGFLPTNSGTATSLDFGEWVPSGTTPTTVSWALGTSAFASDISSGSTLQVGYIFFGSSGFGYDVYTSHVDGLSGFLTAGATYYLTLGGANDSTGSQNDAWDINSGLATCSFAQNGIPVGDCGLGQGVEGETFTINSGGTVPEPSSIMLFGSGLLALAGVLRRKVSR